VLPAGAFFLDVGLISAILSKKGTYVDDKALFLSFREPE